MNREQGDAPLAAGVDRGRMFWTVSGDSPPHGFPFPNLSAGLPSSLSHPLQEFTWLTGPWAPPAPSLRPLDFLQELGGWPLAWSSPTHPSGFTLASLAQGRLHLIPPTRLHQVPQVWALGTTRYLSQCHFISCDTLMVSDSLQALWEPSYCFALASQILTQNRNSRRTC